MKAEDYGLAEHLGTRGDRGLHHTRERNPYHVVGEILRVRPVRSRAFEGAFLCVDEREVKPQRLSREVVTRAELAGALAPFREGRGLGDDGHQIFSMFTRNALNSGVRAPTSPTMGVSALASQYFARSPASSAETPMNPQWMGMPIW